MRILIATLCIFMGISAVGFANNANLVKDPSFEDATNASSEWTLDSYNKGASLLDFRDGGVNGKCLYIENTKKNHAYAIQEIDVEVGKTYRLMGMAKAEGIGGNKGANIGIKGVLTSTNDVKDTGGKYMPIECYITPNNPKLIIMASLGGYGAEATGRAWFDDISLAEVGQEDIAPDEKVQKVGTTDKPAKGFDGGWFVLMAFTGILLVGSIAYLYLPFGKVDK